MVIISIPVDVPKEEHEFEALAKFEGPSYHTMRRIPGGVAFFFSHQEVVKYEDEVLIQAAEIRKSRRDPIVQARIDKRNQQNGALSKGRGSKKIPDFPAR